MATRYGEIAEELRRLCAQMERRGETRLPSEAELCTRFACSRQTVRSALDALRREGLIEKRRGSGSYLASGRPRDGRVVLLVPEESEYVYPELIRELRRILDARGFSLECRSTGDLHSRERLLLEALRDQPPAALMIEPVSNRFPNPNADLLRELRDAGTALSYLFCAYGDGPPAPCAGEADREGAAQLVGLLASAGHRKIGGLFRCDDSRGCERSAGLQSACAAQGLEDAERRIAWFCAEDRRQILNGSTDLLGLFLRQYWHDCTAVVCQNDEVAYCLLRELERRGTDVPGQLAVASFDDSYYASAGSVGLTSLGHRQRALAEAAAAAVLLALEGREESPAPVPWLPVRRGSA